MCWTHVWNQSVFILPPMFSKPFAIVSLICKSQYLDLGLTLSIKGNNTVQSSNILYSHCLIFVKKIFAFLHLLVLWVSAHMSFKVCMWRSEGNLQILFLSLHRAGWLQRPTQVPGLKVWATPMGSGDQTQFSLAVSVHTSWATLQPQPCPSPSPA